jgi:hypothetical protein
MLPTFRTEIFVEDVSLQIGWYLEETEDPVFAAELAQNFAAAVEETIEFLARNPFAGRPRAARFTDLRGYRGLMCLARSEDSVSIIAFLEKRFMLNAFWRVTDWLRATTAD